MNRSVVFVLSSRYPTEKAYGVTTSLTVEELRSRGQKVDVWVPNFDTPDPEHNPGKILISKRNQLFIRFLNKFSESAGFKLQILLCLLGTVKSSRGKQDQITFWVREPYLCIGLFLFTRRIPIIFEMHFPLKNFTRHLILLGLRRQRILIGALTDTHLESLELETNLEGTFILPMAAPNLFFEVGKNREQKIKAKPVVGYIGKATSSGNDNGLLTFLSSIKLAQDREIKVEFWFVGIEELYNVKLRQTARELGILDSYLKISGHINHKQVPEILAKFDFGLMPYKESGYNRYRFPIKSVEYAAAGLPILATNTASHQQILNPSIAVFYDQVDPHDFVRKLDDLLANEERILNLRKSAADWASNFTYYNRVKQASKAVRNLEKTEH